tara:strand:+ start:44636 stop:45250 length:615 start_codon:yes stop_codon:yes gene_type:complete
MKSKILSIFLIACTVVFLSCKNDVEEKVPQQEQKEQEVVKEAPKKIREKPLTKEQKDRMNGVMTKLMTNKDMNSFTRSLVSAGMLDKLEDLQTEYTILAPNNEVFNKVPTGQNVFNDPSRKEELVEKLNMHIVKGSVTSSDLVQGVQKNSKVTLTTIDGKSLVATMRSDTIVITNQATNKSVIVGKSDIMATNGVLHLVDGFFQ